VRAAPAAGADALSVRFVVFQQADRGTKGGPAASKQQGQGQAVEVMASIANSAPQAAAVRFMQLVSRAEDDLPVLLAAG
jgi:hypothetical protein